MTRFTFFGVVAISLLIPLMSAHAGERLRKNETFCLQSSGGRHGGGEPLLCRFETMAQCNASKTGNSDYCMENPEIGFRKRGWHG